MQRVLRWFALAWALGAYGVLLWLPMYGWAQSTQTVGGREIRSAGRATLASVNGPEVYMTLAIPVIAAALAAFPWPAGLVRPAVIVGAVIATAFVILGMLSVGMFFFPSAIALVALALTARPSSRPAT
jgi:hypothetical protein